MDAYQKLSEKYTDEEIAESFVLPLSLSEEEQKEMRALRLKHRNTMTDQEKMYSALMQLKYRIIRYTEEEKL